MVFLEQDEQQNTKADWYLAQIAAEVRRNWVDKPKEVEVRDFLLKQVSAETAIEERVQRSKAVWASFLRVDLKGKRN